jgi:hypothetical protein
VLSSHHRRSGSERPGGLSRAARGLGLGIALLAVLAAVVVRAEDGPPPKSAPAAPPETGKSEPGKPAGRGLDDLKLPPGAIVVLCKEMEEGTRLVPKGVFLTTEQYNALQERLARLEAAAKPAKPEAPGRCKLTGQVKQHTVHLKAQFDVTTTVPNTLVALGCGAPAAPSDILLDGHLPMVRSTDDGIVVPVDKPGDHQLTLELDLRLEDRGGERGFDLDLPRAAITTLELELSDPAIKEVHCTLPDRGARVVRTLMTHVGDGKNRLDTGPLGPLARLEISWRLPAPAPPSGEPLLTADGRITVRVSENTVTTDADFTLRPLRGQVAEWRFLLPAAAELLNPRLPDGRIQSFAPDAKNPALNVLHLNAPSADPLEVAFRIVQPRAGSAVPVGPFSVLGAFRHTGTLLVTAPADLRVTAQARGDAPVALTPRDITDKDPQAVAAFAYSATPLPEAKELAAPPVPFLTLDVEAAGGGSATWTAHTLSLTEGAWRVTTDIDVIPLRPGGVDYLEVQLPPGYKAAHGPRPAPPGQRLEIDSAAGVAKVLLSKRTVEPFRVALEGQYRQGAEAHRTLLELPQARKTLDRGGQVTVVLPRDMELVAPSADDPAWAGLAAGKFEYSWRTQQMPERVEVAWRVPRAELVADTTADVTLSGGQAQVRQRLVFPTAPPPVRVLLWVPETLDADRLRVVERGKAAAPADGDAPPKTREGFRPWRVDVTAPLDREHPLVLEYAFPLPEPDPATHARRFSVPLVVPDPATRVETRVRAWCEPGAPLVLVNDHGWERYDDIGDRDTVPTLCLSGQRPDQAPILSLGEPAGAGQALSLIERALVQATVEENGAQRITARFLLNRLLTPMLDVELPAPPGVLSLDIRLRKEQQEVKQGWTVVDENGQPANAGKIIRLVIPAEFARGPFTLSVAYQLPAERGQESGTWRTVVVPPLPRGEPGRFPVRFQVHLPAAWVPLYPEGGFTFEQSWGWRGWLPAPRPALDDADLERWFEPRPGNAEAAAGSSGQGAGADPASLVCSRSSLVPLRVYHVPQTIWLLLCSTVLAALGLGLYQLSFAFGRRVEGGSPSGTAPADQRLRLPGSLFWPLVVALGIPVVVATLLWPGVLGQVLYGAGPGALVLLVVLGMQWGVQQRYRRQVVFLPGFKRSKPGSSQGRAGSSATPARPAAPGQRAGGEPSTVDGPPVAGGQG